MFTLHPKLKEDTVFIKDFRLCQLLLVKNALYPWFILVPKKDNLVEIIDLSDQDQIILMKEIQLVSKIIKNNLKADKLNIAALGNMVPQLHIHIIARFFNDITFPNPVWCGNKNKKYNDVDIQKLLKNFQ